MMKFSKFMKKHLGTFAGKTLPICLITCAIAYMFSGYAGLYSEQKILYSNLEPKFIDKKVGKK